MAWTCPECGRTFGARGRSHVCRPGLTLEEYLVDARPECRGIVERIAGRLESLPGDLIVDPIDAGVMFKHGAMCVMVTSMTRWVAVGFLLGRELDSARLSRKVADRGSRHWHVVNLTSSDQADEELLEWVEEAFLLRHPDLRAEPGPTPGHPDVPDDVDLPF